MISHWFRQIDRTNAFVALGVGLVVFVIYALTKAVTLTFWDCGEFIACCHILGIPHPPGSPLYVLVGRLFAVFPLFVDAAARINFLSVVSSSLTAMLAYLCAVRILRFHVTDSPSLYQRVVQFGGAACGALFLAFGKTQWGNAVEAEVYGLAMLIFFVMLWLTLVYHQRTDSSSGVRLMMAVVYLAFLGIGVHMTTFLALPVCALFFILKRDTPARYWMIVAGVLLFELYLIFALSSRPGEVPFFVPVLIMFVIYLLYLFSLEQAPRITPLFIAGYLLTIAPICAPIVRAITGAANASGTPIVLSIIGFIGGAGLVVLAAYAFFVERTKGFAGRAGGQVILVSLLFVGVTALAVLIPLLRLRGYTAFLFLSALLLMSLGLLISKQIRWPILIALAGASTVMIGVLPFLYGLSGVLVLSVIMMTVTKNPEWRTALLVIAVAVMGYSVHLFLPIRSAQKPMIDHSSLSQGFSAMTGFLDRKQYTSQSMMERMFVRRAEWQNQFGNYQRMGFWRFFQEQFGVTGRGFFILFVLGVFGLWEIVRRAPQVGLTLTLLAVIGSVGLVLYMNFADGTRQNPVTGGDYIEVRDRDYFFTPAFMLFGLAIGLGIATIVGNVKLLVAKYGRLSRRLILGCSLSAFLLPVYALAGNYWEADRSRNYIAYDYARNILDSADPNAVLFTYGDNDTFPLWCLQEAFRFRNDVRIVNLSLAGSKWYMKQVRDYMRVDLGWTDAQIDQIRGYQAPDGRVFNIFDQVIDAIVDHNHQRRPINFSTTVPTSYRHYRAANIDQRLMLSGLVWRFRDSASVMAVSVDECFQRYTDRRKFQVRGLVDPTLFKDNNMLRLTTSYADGILITADSLRKANRLGEAEQLVRFALDSLPYQDELASLLGAIYADQKDAGKLETLLASVKGEARKWLSVQLAHLKKQSGQKVEAEALLNQIVLTSPTYRPAFEELARLYNENLQYSNLRTLFQFWLQANPDDHDVRSLMVELDRVVRERHLTDTEKK